MAYSDIYLYCASGRVQNTVAFERAVARLEQVGLKLEIDQTAFAQYLRFAGDDSQRTQAIHRAANSNAKIKMLVRGGYGITRILADIDFELLKTSCQKHIWLGFSDFTALQAAIYSKVNCCTWAGAMLLNDFGADQPPTTSQLQLLNSMLNDNWQGASWSISPNTKESLNRNLQLEGRVWGGNLTVLTSLLGTNYMPKITNGILYFEDVSEHPYRIERMFSQWLHSGILEQQQAIVLGQFSDYELKAQDNGLDMNTVINYLRSKLNIPVLTGLPFGHESVQVYLPFGKKIKLSTTNQQIEIFHK